MSRDEIRAVYRQGEDAVVALIEMLISRFNALEEKVARLEAQIAKDSHNSSKPPSSDIVSGAEEIEGKILEAERRPAWAWGHTLQQVENPDHINIHQLHGRCRCGRELGTGKFIGYKQRQVFDLPPIRIEVTEHRAEVRKCECGREHIARFPESVVAPVQYGNQVRAIMVYFSSFKLLPQNRLIEAMQRSFQCSRKRRHAQ